MVALLGVCRPGFAQKPGDEKVPRILNRAEVEAAIAAAYPREHLRARQGGTVVLEMIVEVDSVPSQLRLRESSGFAALDSVALVLAERMRFAPATVFGRAVPVRITVPLNFNPGRRRRLGILGL